MAFAPCTTRAIVRLLHQLREDHNHTLRIELTIDLIASLFRFLAPFVHAPITTRYQTVTHHTVQCCQLRSSPELGHGWLVSVPCKNWVLQNLTLSSYFRACASLLPVMRALVASQCPPPPPLFVLLCADMFCWVFIFCIGVVAVMAEAKAEIEVDFGSCCSNCSNRLLCLRLCHIGNFQVRMCRVLSYVMMWLWLGAFHKLNSFLHLPSAGLPQSEVLPTTFSHFCLS